MTVIERMIRRCRWLERQLRAQGQPRPWRVSTGFARLELLVERLPPNQVDASDLGYLRNRVPSSRRLWEDGEKGAACTQLRELRRKLQARVAP